MMKVVLSISITVVVLCALYAVLSYQLIFPFEGWTRESLGQFGDSWGGLTSIFSAAAFCGVLWTIKLQKDSMIYLEEESRKQHESDIVRDFENSFFNMVNLLQTIIKDMKVDGETTKKEGRLVFIYFYSRFMRKCINKFDVEDFEYIDVENYSVENEKKIFSEEYDDFFSGRSGNFSHYYRLLYNIFKFISDSSIDDNSKKKYANILRAQLSNYELLMLLYNGNSKNGLKFKEYFNEYAVMDNLPVDKLISDAHVFFIEEKAWGDNHDALLLFSKAKQSKAKCYRTLRA